MIIHKKLSAIDIQKEEYESDDEAVLTNAIGGKGKDIRKECVIVWTKVKEDFIRIYRERVRSKAKKSNRHKFPSGGKPSYEI